RLDEVDDLRLRSRRILNHSKLVLTKADRGYNTPLNSPNGRRIGDLEIQRGSVDAVVSTAGDPTDDLSVRILHRNIPLANTDSVLEVGLHVHGFWHVSHSFS